MAYIEAHGGVSGVQGDMIAEWHRNLLAPIQEDARLLPLEMGGVVLNSGGPEGWLSAFPPGSLERKLKRISSGAGSRAGMGGLAEDQRVANALDAFNRILAANQGADPDYVAQAEAATILQEAYDAQNLASKSPADEQYPMSPVEDQFVQIQPGETAQEFLNRGGTFAPVQIQPGETAQEYLNRGGTFAPAPAASQYAQRTVQPTQADQAQAPSAPSQYVQRTVQPTQAANQAQAPAAQAQRAAAPAPPEESALSVIGKILGGVNQGAQAFLGKKQAPQAPAAPSGSSVIPVVIGVVAAGAIAYALGRATS